MRDGGSNWTGIPVFKLTQEETEKLLHMEDELHKRVIGQSAAVDVVSQEEKLKDVPRLGEAVRSAMIPVLQTCVTILQERASVPAAT